MIKKIILSLVVVSAFVFYIYLQKNHGNEEGSLVGTPVTQSLSSNRSIKKLQDGTFTGQLVDAYYGNVQVEATIKSGQISEVRFLDYPSDRTTSERINSQAIPLLIQEAIQSQSYQVDIVSGATQTSKAFIESLKSALAQAS